MKFALPVLFSVLLGACATTAGYEKQLATWVGKNEVELVRGWGPPNQSYEVSGRRFLVYTVTRDVVVPGNAPIPISNSKGKLIAILPGTADTTASSACTTSFELLNARVVSWSHRGDDCTARE